MEENSTEDGFVIMRNSMMQELLDMKCGECGSRNFVSRTESTVALVTIFSVRCRHCGKQELINTQPRTVEEFRQVDKVIIDYTSKSRGGQELVRDERVMKTDEETIIKEEIQEIKEEIDIKEENLESEFMKTSNELIVPETIEASVGLVENADLHNRHNDGKDDEQADNCCMCTPLNHLSRNMRHLCHYCGNFFEDIATHFKDCCGQGKGDELAGSCCMCTPLNHLSSNIRHLCHYCGNFFEDMATHLQDCCGQGRKHTSKHLSQATVHSSITMATCVPWCDGLSEDGELLLLTLGLNKKKRK